MNLFRSEWLRMAHALVLVFATTAATIPGCIMPRTPPASTSSEFGSG